MVHGSRACRFRNKALLTLALLAGANLVAWAAALITFHHFAVLLGTATLAYTLGLRHAVDADHISAIDNVTRKLMQEGQRPLLVGFFFSLGHSTVVVLLSVVIALTAAHIQSRFPDIQRIGGLIGTTVSAVFLLVIAGINLLVLRGVVGAFRRVKRGEPYDEQDPNAALDQLGVMGRIFRPVLRIVDRSWKMYWVGLLFGLGFDTATEVGLLGISAAAATQGLPVWSILLFPALFTAGMCLVDTLDGILMLGAYGWAYVHPVRKLYYNMTITAVSVIIAVAVGGIEVLSMLAGRLNLHGPGWDTINSLGNHMGAIGILIIAIFILSWAASTLGYRMMGYKQLEFATGPALPEADAAKESPAM
ncbi:MAG: nickel transporter [Phycisphaerales bacterium]|jgi:high-affinity nickel-transport protein|nr:nickel transporter [Phycisphaerales bacterium]